MTARFAAAELALLELEAEVIAHEAAAGWSIPGATRPLHEWEVRARTRFADLDSIAARYAGEVERLLGQFHVDLLATIRLLLLRDQPPATVADLADQLAEWARSPHPDLDALDAALTNAYLGAGTAAYRESFYTLTQESLRQGMPAERVAAALDRLEGLDDATVRRLRAGLGPLDARARVLGVAAAEARRFALEPGATPADVAAAALEAASPERLTLADVRDTSRQGLLNAVGAGRAAAADALPNPVEVYASELLDRATCGPCAALDGRMYESLAAAYADYPGGAGFRDCLGGGRCRGTLVMVWDTEEAPSLDQGPFQQVGRFPVDRTPRGPASTPDDGQLTLPGAG